jgi:hypothetical protein
LSVVTPNSQIQLAPAQPLAKSRGQARLPRGRWPRALAQDLAGSQGWGPQAYPPPHWAPTALALPPPRSHVSLVSCPPGPSLSSVSSEERTCLQAVLPVAWLSHSAKPSPFPALPSAWNFPEEQPPCGLPLPVLPLCASDSEPSLSAEEAPLQPSWLQDSRTHFIPPHPRPALQGSSAEEP